MPEPKIKKAQELIRKIKKVDKFDISAFLNSRTAGVLSLLILAVLITLLTSMSPQYIPSDAIEGTFAPHNIKADRSYEIMDDEATNKLREEATSGVLSIYDFDKTPLKDALARAHDALNAARSIYRDIYASRAPAGRKTGLNAVEKKRLKDTFSEKLGSIELSDSHLNALVKERFNQRVDDVLAQVVRGIMSKPVISDESALTNEGEKGIIVRLLKETVPEGGIQYEEKVVKDLSQIPSKEKAIEQLDASKIQGANFRSPDTPKAIIEIAKKVIQSNLTPNKEETKKRREAAAADVTNVIIKIKPGEMIIREGARFEPRHIKILSGISMEKAGGRFSLEFFGTFLLVLVFLILPFYLAEKFFHQLRPTRADHYFMALAGLSILTVMRIYLLLAPGIREATYLDIAISSFYYAIPIAGGAMLVRMFLGPEITLVFGVVLSVLAGFFVETDIHFIPYCLMTILAGIITIAKADKRSLIIRSGAITGSVAAFTVLCLKLISLTKATEALTAPQIIWTMFFAFMSGIGSAIFSMIATPIVESLSGYTSDIKLLELANLNHPLLRELIVRAPGTYHHSHLVGILGEAAAEAIGANALLVRVGAYYHDIGKMRKPQYFIENMKGESKHEKLSPHMSSLIVSSHVKDGVDMAQSSGIPKCISDMIPQHHGTRLIGFFYDKAKSLEDPTLQKIDQKDFTYPGPKPQTREAAILMLADVTEASVRALKEKSTTRIQQTVQRAINDIFAESQLDECELTLRDLNNIAKAFVRILMGIYHQRIEYPKDIENGKIGKQEIEVIDEESTIIEEPDESARKD